jgi:hypothetical protein
MFKLAAVLGLAVLVFCGYRYRDTFIYRTSPSPYGIAKTGTLFYDRWRADDDYIVLSGNGCRIINREGKTIYSFLRLHCHLFKDGSVFMGNDLGYQYFGPDGANLWTVNQRLHHDVDVSQDEKEFFILSDVFPKGGVNHLILGYSRDGREIFRWDSGDHIPEIEKVIGRKISYNPTRTHETEYMHLNSVQILPPNALEKVNPAFRRGNILSNCVKYNMTFIVDRDTKKIVWHHFYVDPSRDVEDYSDRGLPDWKFREPSIKDATWKGAHTVRLQKSGEILLFNNTARFSTPYNLIQFSAIQKLDPITHKTLWSYHSDPVQNFFTAGQGGVFELKNGNFLIAHSLPGSAFEITREGRLVWEWFGDPIYPFTFSDSTLYKAYPIPRKLADKIVRVWEGVN